MDWHALAAAHPRLGKRSHQLQARTQLSKTKKDGAADEMDEEARYMQKELDKVNKQAKLNQEMLKKRERKKEKQRMWQLMRSQEAAQQALQEIEEIEKEKERQLKETQEKEDIATAAAAAAVSQGEAPTETVAKMEDGGKDDQPSNKSGPDVAAMLKKQAIASEQKLQMQRKQKLEAIMKQRNEMVVLLSDSDED